MFRGVLAGGGTLHVSLCLCPACGTLLDTCVLLLGIHSPYPGNGTLVFLWGLAVFCFNHHFECIQRHRCGSLVQSRQTRFCWTLTAKPSGSNSEADSDVLTMRPEPQGATR